MMIHYNAARIPGAKQPVAAERVIMKKQQYVGLSMLQNIHAKCPVSCCPKEAPKIAR